MLLFWYSGPNVTSLNVHAELNVVNSTAFEGSTLGEDNYCSGSNLCQNNEGDCDFDSHCDVGLSCGNDNCPSYLGFPSGADCCHDPCQGYEIQFVDQSGVSHDSFFHFTDHLIR